MKIVLDTNVLVAGLLSPHGPCAEIVRMVTAGKLILCVDARILSEYSEVLQRPKFQFDEDLVRALLDYIEHHSHITASSLLADPLPDTDDEPFLEVSLSAEAECLVTGNRAHFPIRLCQGMKVFSPADFLIYYRKQKR